MTRRAYWRSLEQAAGDPSVRDFLEREFPEGAADPPEELDRRTMLKLIGASVSLAGLAACRRPEEKIVPYVHPPEEIVPGIPQHYATSMPFGHDAFGIVVESHEGRPTKIEGNERHPATAGASSVWIQAAVLNLYDPDRSPALLQGGTAATPERIGVSSTRGTWEQFVAAWPALAHAAEGGRGLWILGESFASPTLARLGRRLAQNLPQARHVAWEPISDENVYRGLALAAGVPLRPLHHLERAEVILSLDGDFLLTESDAVRQARGFAEGRRVASARDAMSRLWVVESGLSLTGANADHRLRLPSSRIAALLGRLAGKLGAGPGGPEVEGLDDARVDALAADLAAHRGRSLVIAGRVQPPEVHAAVAALNVALGNAGTTVTWIEPQDAALPDRQALAALVAAMRAGEVRTLLILGGNPVYDAPADLGFAEALGQVERVVHLSSHVDETSRHAHWHIPRNHFLESWGDARSADGTASLIQPLIAPLYASRSDVEVLNLAATGADRPGHDVVLETWRERWGEAGFEDRWWHALHDGVAEEASPPSAAAPQATAFAALGALGAASGAGLEVVFVPSPALWDGRFANNAWLLELPDPITKLTWDNAIFVGPSTAAELSLVNEGVARLSLGEREVEGPVWIVPGLADGTVVLHLGWGRSAAGSAGTGRGFDAYRLRTTAAFDVARGATLAATGRTYELAQTQDHWSMEGRPIVLERTLAEYREEPSFAAEAVEHPPLESIYPDRDYSTGHQWGMSIDLNACVGCNACVVACQSENNVPVVGKQQVRNGREMHWIRVDRYFREEHPLHSAPPEVAASSPEDRENPPRLSDPQVVFQPMPCQQCENAPCEEVCPVAATVHDAEGLNVMVYNRCIGTRYCSNNCPYKVRRFNFFNYTKDTPPSLQVANNPDVTVRSRGVMEKCTYCVQRINSGKLRAKLAGEPVRDGDIRPACQQACPTGAIVFGDIADPESRVSRLKQQDRDYTILVELNNRPRTTYLAKLRNPLGSHGEG